MYFHLITARISLDVQSKNFTHFIMQQSNFRLASHEAWEEKSNCRPKLTCTSLCPCCHHGEKSWVQCWDTIYFPRTYHSLKEKCRYFLCIWTLGTVAHHFQREWPLLRLSVWVHTCVCPHVWQMSGKGCIPKNNLIFLIIPESVPDFSEEKECSYV